MVAGMMRSGTSAITGALSRLGLAASDDDLHNVINPTGYYESLAISGVNLGAMSLTSSTWYCPPRERARMDEVVKKFFESSRGRIADALDAGPSVFKDPKAGFFLPLWRETLAAIGRPCGAVFVWRAADEVALSLWRSNRLPIEHGLALWAESNRAFVSGLAGLPVFACRYEKVVARPDVLVAGVGELMDVLGLDGFAPDPCDARSFLTGSLRREGGLPESHPSFARVSSLHRWVEELSELEGLHAAFPDRSTAMLPPIPDWAEQLLGSVRRDVDEITAARVKTGASR